MIAVDYATLKEIKAKERYDENYDYFCWKIKEKNT